MFLTVVLFRPNIFDTPFFRDNFTESVLLLKGKISQCVSYGKYHILLATLMYEFIYYNIKIHVPETNINTREREGHILLILFSNTESYTSA